MAKTKNVKRTDRGVGADFINQKRAVDDAINEQLKQERGREKLDPEQNNSRKNEQRPGISEKKTGHSSH
jgi:hypothetical protein